MTNPFDWLLRVYTAPGLEAGHFIFERIWKVDGKKGGRERNGSRRKIKRPKSKVEEE